MTKTRMPVVSTARLILRPFVPGDVESLYHMMNDRDVMRYFPAADPLPLEKVDKLIQSQLKHWEAHGYGWWAVELRSDRQLIGWSGLQYLPETDETEVAYLLGKPFWGRGLATEAAQAGLHFGFETLGLPAIVAIVHPQNLASQGVIRRLDMSFVDCARYFGMNCYRYRILRSEHELPSEAGSAAH